MDGSAQGSPAQGSPATLAVLEALLRARGLLPQQAQQPSVGIPGVNGAMSQSPSGQPWQMPVPVTGQRG